MHIEVVSKYEEQVSAEGKRRRLVRQHLWNPILVQSLAIASHVFW